MCWDAASAEIIRSPVDTPGLATDTFSHFGGVQETKTGFFLDTLLKIQGNLKMQISNDESVTRPAATPLWKVGHFSMLGTTSMWSISTVVPLGGAFPIRQSLGIGRVSVGSGVVVLRVTAPLPTGRAIVRTHRD